MKRLNLFFAIIMAFFISLFLFFLFFPPSNAMLSSQKSVLFYEGKDWFADFFNVMRYMSDEAGFYFSKINEYDGHSGFPIGRIFLYPLTLLVDYSHMSLQDCWTSKSAIFSCVAYLIILIFFFWDSLNKVCEKYGVAKYNLLVLLFSSVFIFSLERANGVFLPAILINYYLLYYDSKNPNLKWFALVCLCFAAALKGYPVFFGLLLLKERRYKDIVFCIAFTLIIVFVPFAFLERGFENLSKMIENTEKNNVAYLHNYIYLFGLHKLIYLVCLAFHLSESNIDVVIGFTRVAETFMGLYTFILVLAEDRLHRQLLLIICAVLLMPINSGFYCALFLFPVLLIFFSERKRERLDYVIVALLCLVLNPFQIIIPYKLSQIYLTPLLSNFAMAFMWILLLLSSTPKLKNVKLKNLL